MDINNADDCCTDSTESQQLPDLSLSPTMPQDSVSCFIPMSLTYSSLSVDSVIRIRAVPGDFDAHIRLMIIRSGFRLSLLSSAPPTRQSRVYNFRLSQQGLI